jgi:hypothetical protein
LSVFGRPLIVAAWQPLSQQDHPLAVRPDFAAELRQRFLGCAHPFAFAKNPDVTWPNPASSRPKPAWMSANATRVKGVAETPQNAEKHSRTQRRYAGRHDEKKA